MKKIITIAILTILIIPLTLSARRRKVYPMMMGPKLSVSMFEGDESVYPVHVSGDMLINLYKNYFWLRTDILTLSVGENWNSLGINRGIPFDIMFMGRYGNWRPYGFGGFEILVDADSSSTDTYARIDAGGGLSYEASRGLHIFGEGGVDLGYYNPAPGNSDPVDLTLFLGVGARFAFIW